MGTWAILRTSGPRTLLLADSLNLHGIAAWTPVAIVRKRTMRGKRSAAERPAAIMPTFVFVPSQELPGLYPLAKSPLNPHPPFSVFKFDGRIPLVSDGEIERLKTEERRAVPKAKLAQFAKGQSVRVPEGSFAGMVGEVEKTDGGYTVVCFPAFGRHMTVKIATSILRPNDIRETSLAA